MTAWYNEPDKFKAEVLRQAIAAGAIADGVVDERSIVDVRATDLVGFTQCHFFAGGGFWSLALRQAGWPDEEEAWTGSCPCPSFSAAGKGEGFADARHLWPFWYPLIRERRPRVVFGEQVATAIGHGWLDLVSTDMEAAGYAIAPAVLGAHSLGAPHIRQRLFFVAESGGVGFDSGSASTSGYESRAALSQHGSESECMAIPKRDDSAPRLGCGSSEGRQPDIERGGRLGDMGQSIGAGLEGYGGDGEDRNESGRVGEVAPRSTSETGKSGCMAKSSDPRLEGGARKLGSGAPPEDTRSSECGGDCSLADAELDEQRSGRISGSEREPRLEPGIESGGCGEVGELGDPEERRLGMHGGTSGSGRYSSQPNEIGRPGSLNGFWRDADWLFCRDGRWRPVKSGTFPLVAGYTGRVGLLRLAGDAICVPVAKAFIQAYREITLAKFHK